MNNVGKGLKRSHALCTVTTSSLGENNTTGLKGVVEAPQEYPQEFGMTVAAMARVRATDWLLQEHGLSWVM